MKNGLIIDDPEFGSTKRWYKNGILHRENDLPAIEYRNGTKHWYKEGLRHRENGQAIVRVGKNHNSNNGIWCLNGEELTESEYKQQSRENRLKQLLDE